jgi:hypothetical protein
MLEVGAPLAADFELRLGPGAVRHLCAHRQADIGDLGIQPGSENMPAFASALQLLPQSLPSSQRVLKVLREDHSDTCSATYADTHAYAWLDGTR